MFLCFSLPSSSSLSLFIFRKFFFQFSNTFHFLFEEYSFFQVIILSFSLTLLVICDLLSCSYSADHHLKVMSKKQSPTKQSSLLFGLFLVSYFRIVTLFNVFFLNDSETEVFLVKRGVKKRTKTYRFLLFCV